MEGLNKKRLKEASAFLVYEAINGDSEDDDEGYLRKLIKWKADQNIGD
jgi:hypothetical protein